MRSADPAAWQQVGYRPRSHTAGCSVYSTVPTAAWGFLVAQSTPACRVRLPSLARSALHQSRAELSDSTMGSTLEGPALQGGASSKDSSVGEMQTMD